MATPISINRVAIEELRRSIDVLNRSDDKLRFKNLTFIAAAFAVLTYLYGSGDLFIPPQIYGRILYFIGLSFLLTSVIIFLMELRPYRWELTTEIKQLKSIKQSTESDYLEYVKAEYISTFTANAGVYEKRHSWIQLGFILLIVGGFTLIIIKTFPDNAQACYINKGTTCSVVQDRKGQ